MTALALPLTDNGHLRRRVRALAENRPAVYRMIDATGRVIYVGKAKRLRNRLLSYFRARYPEDKAARIIHAAADIQWDLMPSEFAALLAELRQIRRYRPVFNVRMNRNRRLGFIKVSDGPAPKIFVGSTPGADQVRHYGPFSGVGRLKEGVRVLNDLLNLRDCALKMPVTFPDQQDLFVPKPRAACLRHELGHCAGPCAGLVTEREYRDRVRKAIAFLETTSMEPLDEVVVAMTAAGERQEFELAAYWRDRFDALEWLLAASVRAQASVAALSFVYIDPGVYGDDRAYVIKRGTVRASAPAPHTPIEREAFDAIVRQHIDPEPESKAIPAQSIDETLILLQWFRKRPQTLSRTVPLQEWCERGGPI
jgi:excinuclease ABC subunit C